MRTQTLAALVWMLAVPPLAAAEDVPSNKPSADAAPAKMAALRPGSLLALLPPAGSPAADSSADSAVQEVSSALRKKGYRVLSPAQVSARLTGHAPDAC
ncbi:MAG TPA: hypothetical protein VGI70_16695, partial [Polyangiales bacterium]